MPQVCEQRLCSSDAQHDPAQHAPAVGSVVDEPDCDPGGADALEDGGAIQAEVIGADAEDGTEGQGGRGRNISRVRINRGRRRLKTLPMQEREGSERAE